MGRAARVGTYICKGRTLPSGAAPAPRAHLPPPPPPYCIAKSLRIRAHARRRAPSRPPTPRRRRHHPPPPSWGLGEEGRCPRGARGIGSSQEERARPADFRSISDWLYRQRFAPVLRMKPSGQARSPTDTYFGVGGSSNRLISLPHLSPPQKGETSCKPAKCT